jgi:hypothetical protein
MCGNSNLFTGIQAFVSDGRNGISMNKFGNSGGSELPCLEWYLKDKEYITSLELAFSSSRVTYVKVTNNKGMEFGRGLRPSVGV